MAAPAHLAALHEQAFRAAGSVDEHEPGRLDTRIVKTMYGATRQEHDIAARRSEGLVAAEELQLAVDEVKGLVSPFVDVRRGAATRRHRRLDETDLAARLRAGQLGRVNVAVEPGGHTIPVRDVYSAVLQILEIYATHGHAVGHVEFPSVVADEVSM